MLKVRSVHVQLNLKGARIQLEEFEISFGLSKLSNLMLRDVPGLPGTRCTGSIVASALIQRDVDVVVVGAGIVGLMTAKALLEEGLSVALVERKQLCAGATGAGQGYIWMAHRSPLTAGWDLASWSIREWKALVEVHPELQTETEWQTTGSLLLASTEAEAQQLKERQAMLSSHGVASMYLNAAAVQELEPAVSIPEVGGGLVTDLDSQIVEWQSKGQVHAQLVPGTPSISLQTNFLNFTSSSYPPFVPEWQSNGQSGRATARFMLNWCQAHPHFVALMDEPVERILMEPPQALVETLKTRLLGRLGVVVAAGAWSGQLLSSASGQSEWEDMFRPHKGHLLEMMPPPSMPRVQRGMMEMSYVKHYTTATPDPSTTTAHPTTSTNTPTDADITFTATTSATGSLLIGSSREFCGFGQEPSEAVVHSILQRATHFLPHLAQCEPPQGAAVRVGLRPHAAGGLPLVGPIPGVPGLFVAAGHDGSGLTLGPGTAQLIKHHILGGGVEDAAKYADFLPQSRVSIGK
eukprot:gene12539-15754_t